MAYAIPPTPMFFDSAWQGFVYVVAHRAQACLSDVGGYIVYIYSRGSRQSTYPVLVRARFPTQMLKLYMSFGVTIGFRLKVLRPQKFFNGRLGKDVCSRQRSGWVFNSYVYEH